MRHHQMKIQVYSQNLKGETSIQSQVLSWQRNTQHKNLGQQERYVLMQTARNKERWSQSKILTNGGTLEENKNK